MNDVLDLDVNDFLSHHGVKGQRWGIRNKKATSGNGNKRKAGAQKAKRILSVNRKTKVKSRKSKSRIKRGFTWLDNAFGEAQANYEAQRQREEAAMQVLREKQAREERTRAIADIITGIHNRSRG